jgi:ribosomal protein S18 acetylase RimI-like enzyme
MATGSSSPRVRKPRIREATEADLPRLVALLAQLAPDVPDREDASEPLPYAYHLMMRRILETPGEHVYVLESRKQIIGSVALSIVPNLSHQGSPYAIIENVIVDGRHRSKGYGEALIDHAVAEARKAGCYKVSLMSNKRRQDAHRFYGRLGFQRTHEAFRLNLD